MSNASCLNIFLCVVFGVDIVIKHFLPSLIPCCFQNVSFSSGLHASSISGDICAEISLSIAAILTLRNFNSALACLSFKSDGSSFGLKYGTAESEFLRILSPASLLAASKTVIKTELKNFFYATAIAESYHISTDFIYFKSLASNRDLHFLGGGT